MRIGIDIDSTLHHYWGQLEDAARRLYGVELPYERQRTWAIDGLEPEQLRACIRDTHDDERILAAEPYPGAVEAIRAWRADGHFIHITSHRSTRAHAATARWLDRIGLPFDELYCSYDKVTRCVEIGIDVLIDDSPVNLVRARESGITGATIRHPWNAEVCDRDGILCADDWPGLVDRLAPVLAGN
ncbi:MAG TPA: hypothetical protein VM266_11730 [Solirubrobacteraceae bacterium]|nr:hypothetical protein [Solirubrobacteraceae bacterium]